MKCNESQRNEMKSNEIQQFTTKFNETLMKYNEMQQNTMKYDEIHTKCNRMLRVSCLGSSPSLRTDGHLYESKSLYA